MSRKKQAKEELINTHVININEIREAEREEKHLKFKKKTVVFFVFGILVAASNALAKKAGKKPVEHLGCHNCPSRSFCERQECVNE